jgi:hypothetical protein
MEEFDQARVSFEQSAAIDPSLAEGEGYLASRSGGSGDPSAIGTRATEQVDLAHDIIFFEELD